MSGLKVVDVLPSCISYTGGNSDNGWSISHSGQTVTATLSVSLAPCSESSFKLKVNATKCAEGTCLPNTATVTGTGLAQQMSTFAVGVKKMGQCPTNCGPQPQACQMDDSPTIVVSTKC